MKSKDSGLLRWAGLAAMAAGILFILIQAIHPPDTLSSVATERWAFVHYLGVGMCLLGLLGLAGLYMRQMGRAGWVALVGYLLFSLFFALTMAFQFAEAFFLPLLVDVAPAFVAGFLGIVTGVPSETDLGALPTLFGLAGVLYVLGGVLFGIGTLRAGILPRWAGGLLAIAAVATLAAALLPHPLDRILAVPMGAALAWLGYALWSERREAVTEPAGTSSGTQVREATE